MWYPHGILRMIFQLESQQISPMKESTLRRMKPEDPEIHDGRGLYFKKNKNGSVTCKLRKKMKGRRSPLARKLGEWDGLNGMSIDEAERKASQYRKLIDQGIDPKDYEKEIATKEKADKKTAAAKAVTLRQLHEEYMRSRLALEKHQSERTRKDYEKTIPQVWADFLDGPIQDITDERLWDFYQYWASQRVSLQTGKPAIAQLKKGIRYLRAELNYAKHVKKYISRNPCDVFNTQVSMAARRRTYYLRPSETRIMYKWVQDLLQADEQQQAELRSTHRLTKYEVGKDPHACLDLILLELLTGLRQIELLTLKWNEVYLDEEDYKEQGAVTGSFFQVILSKQQTDFGVPITPLMASVFRRRLKARSSEYVFPSSILPNTHMGDDRVGFRILKKLMPVETLRKTDSLSSNVLRHTFATTGFNVLKSMELTDMITGHYVKHNRGVSTPTYVHMQADDHREHFEKIGEMLTDAQHTPDISETEGWIEPYWGEEGHGFAVVGGGYSLTAV